MDDEKNKTTPVARELVNHFEEDNLWDLEDDWEEDGEPTAHTLSEPPVKEETAPLTSQEVTEEITTSTPEENIDTPQKTIITDDEKRSILEEITKREQAALEKTPLTEASTDPAPVAEYATEQIPKKAGLNFIEIIALSVVALFFLGLGIWGYMFLLEKNKLGKQGAKLEFPIEGKYVTISNFTTFWKNAKDLNGVKLGAIVVPGASITLADDSSESGALRAYFSNADNKGVGDPITIVFNNGQFSNGKKNIDIIATDGFHQEGDYNAYTVNEALYWHVQILEASNENVSGSEFQEALETTVKPIRK